MRTREPAIDGQPFAVSPRSIDPAAIQLPATGTSGLAATITLQRLPTLSTETCSHTEDAVTKSPRSEPGRETAIVPGTAVHSIQRQTYPGPLTGLHPEYGHDRSVALLTCDEPRCTTVAWSSQKPVRHRWRRRAIHQNPVRHHLQRPRRFPVGALRSPSSHTSRSRPRSAALGPGKARLEVTLGDALIPERSGPPKGPLIPR